MRGMETVGINFSSWGFSSAPPRAGGAIAPPERLPLMSGYDPVGFVVVVALVAFGCLLVALAIETWFEGRN